MNVTTDTMRGVLIDPTAKTVTDVQIKKDTYKRIGEAIRCDTITCTSVSSQDDLWLDDEGLLTRPNPHGYFKLGGHLFAGVGLILSHDDEGNSVSTRIPLALVQSTCVFYNEDGLTEKELSPSMFVMEMDENMQPIESTRKEIPLNVRRG